MATKLEVIGFGIANKGSECSNTVGFKVLLGFEENASACGSGTEVGREDLVALQQLQHSGHLGASALPQWGPWRVQKG